MATTRKNTLRELMNKAWYLVRTYGMTMAEAMRQAWAIAKLVKKMHNGIVEFMYKKVDGTMRQAFGTLKADLLPSFADATGGRKKNESVVVYFDTEKQSFRCFKAVNLVNA